MYIIFAVFISIGSLFSSVYNTGEQISEAHQNVSFPVCYGDYPNSNFKLSDLNGVLNGGSYHVIFIDMAASW